LSKIAGFFLSPILQSGKKEEKADFFLSDPLISKIPRNKNDLIDLLLPSWTPCHRSLAT